MPTILIKPNMVCVWKSLSYIKEEIHVVVRHLLRLEMHGWHLGMGLQFLRLGKFHLMNQVWKLQFSLIMRKEMIKLTLSVLVEECRCLLIAWCIYFVYLWWKLWEFFWALQKFEVGMLLLCKWDLPRIHFVLKNFIHKLYYHAPVSQFLQKSSILDSWHP